MREKNGSLLFAGHSLSDDGGALNGARGSQDSYTIKQCFRGYFMHDISYDLHFNMPYFFL
jgi:hypothetical protein